MPTIDPHEGEAVFASATDPTYAPIKEHRDAIVTATLIAETQARRNAEPEPETGGLLSDQAEQGLDSHSSFSD